jgi:hypothetical protein
VAYRNLDEFLTRLAQAGDIAQLMIDRSHPRLPEVAGPDADKAHVFTASNGIRIVQNLFGTSLRIEQSLRVASLNLIAERLEQLLEISKPGTLGVMISRAMTMFSVIRTTTNRRAPSEFQKLSFAEWHRSLSVILNLMGTPEIQATLLTGEDTPRMQAVSVGFDNNELSGEFWPTLRIGGTIALVIGGDPAFMLAAHAPLPDFIHRSYFASWLRDRPLDMMRLPGLDIEVPSNIETMIVATVRERFEEVTRLDVISVWTKPNAIYPQYLPGELHNLRGTFVEIMLPLIRRFLPGLRDIYLRGPFGILTVEPSKADTQTILRQLWAVPISAGVYYWLLLPDTDDTDGAVERLTLEDISTLSKLMQGKDNLGVLMDAVSKPLPVSEQSPELEQAFWYFKRNWQGDQPSKEL